VKQQLDSQPASCRTSGPTDKTDGWMDGWMGLERVVAERN